MAAELIRYGPEQCRDFEIPCADLNSKEIGTFLQDQQDDRPTQAGSEVLSEAQGYRVYAYRLEAATYTATKARALNK